MEGFEMKRDKSKAFKVSGDTLERVNRLIKQTGKGDTEFFEELVSDLEIKHLTSENNEDIPTDLRKSFQNDVQKMKNATTSIISIFTSQMENIAVEKDRWASYTEKQLLDRDQQLQEQTQHLDELKIQLTLVNQQFSELSEVKSRIEKERDALLKQIESQEKLTTARDEKIVDLTERVNKLNENIVLKEEELKKAEPLREENRNLQGTIAELSQTIQNLNQKTENMKQNHQEELVKQEDALRFEFEKEKLELYKTAAAEQEQIRTQARGRAEAVTREFYTTEIQRLQTSWDKKEDDYKTQVESLREQIRQESQPTIEQLDKKAEE